MTPPLSPTATPTSGTTAVAKFLARLGGMDSRDLSRRSYEHPGYASTQGYGTGLRATSGSGSERFSPVHGQQLPPTRTATSGSASRPSSQPQGFGPYGLQQSRGQYQQHGLPSSPYQYSDFGTPESQRQQQAQQQTPQSQQFSSFPTNMVFSVPSQMSQGSSFETSLPTYQSRAPTSLEALTSHLAMSQQQQPPQQQQFYNTCDAPSVSAQAYASAGPYRAQPGIYRSNTRDHRASAASETSGYQADVAEYTQFAMSNPVEQQQQQQQGQRGDDIQGQGGGGGGEEEDYAAYNENLRQTFQDVLDGRLVDAGQQLLNISEWLVNNAANLGELPAISHH